MKEIKCFLFLIGITLVSPAASAQNLPTTIKVQAMNMGKAFVQNDFTSFVKYMHPNIIAFAGGKEKMRAKMDTAYQMMKQFGISFKTYLIGDPGEIVNYKNQLQAVLPVSTTLKTALAEITAETTLIVISNDKGKNWWFIDTNVYDIDSLKNILPDLSTELIIPARKKPKIVPVANH